MRSRPVFQVYGLLGWKVREYRRVKSHLHELKVREAGAEAQTSERREDSRVQGSDAVRDVNGARKFFKRVEYFLRDCGIIVITRSCKRQRAEQIQDFEDAHLFEK